MNASLGVILSSLATSSAGCHPTTTITASCHPTTTITAGCHPTTTITAGRHPTTTITAGCHPTTTSTAGCHPTTTSTAGCHPTTTSTAGCHPTTTINNSTDVYYLLTNHYTYRISHTDWLLEIYNWYLHERNIIVVSLWLQLKTDSTENLYSIVILADFITILLTPGIFSPVLNNIGPIATKIA